jgi:hypothetical protein
MLPTLATICRDFSIRPSALIDFVGLGDEISCHCDQCCGGLFIMVRRGQPKAEIGLPSEVVGTRHIEIPFDRNQLLKLRRVPTVDEAELPGSYSSVWQALWGLKAAMAPLPFEQINEVNSAIAAPETGCAEVPVG